MRPVAAALFLAAVITAPLPAVAAGHAFLSLSGGYLRQEGGEWFPAAAEARAGYDAALGVFRLESDVSQQWRTRPPGAEPVCAPEPERSGILFLEGHCSANADSRLAVDRLFVAASRGRLDVRLGRQPVNLATNFHFSANDFFSPFRENDFFRDYRPGVDALRLDYAASPLSQASFIGVLSYRPVSRPGGWSRSPDWGRSSALLRWMDNGLGFETVLLAGVVRDVQVLGASLAGDVRGWLGIGAEGHYGRMENGQGDYFAASGALFHRFENSLDLRLEYLYNGNWRDGAAVAAAAPAATRPGRDWLALGAGFEPFPLISLQGLAAANLSEGSRLFSLYATLSIGDASEIALNLHHGSGGPEYGAYGRGVLATLRLSL